MYIHWLGHVSSHAHAWPPSEVMSYILCADANLGAISFPNTAHTCHNRNGKMTSMPIFDSLAVAMPRLGLTARSLIAVARG